jgi:uncharacterized membrane protein
VSAREFSAAVDQTQVVAAIRATEGRSTGEVRVHVSSETADDAQAAAVAVFDKLGMSKTKERNGVLIYIAPRSRKFAVIGDAAIHARCGASFWSELAAAMSQDFRGGRFTEGIVKGVTRAGDLLAQHFPRRAGEKDVNELPDDVTED